MKTKKQLTIKAQKEILEQNGIVIIDSASIYPVDLCSPLAKQILNSTNSSFLIGYQSGFYDGLEQEKNKYMNAMKYEKQQRKQSEERLQVKLRELKQNNVLTFKLVDGLNFSINATLEVIDKLQSELKKTKSKNVQFSILHRCCNTVAKQLADLNSGLSKYEKKDIEKDAK